MVTSVSIGMWRYPVTWAGGIPDGGGDAPYADLGFVQIEDLFSLGFGQKQVTTSLGFGQPKASSAEATVNHPQSRPLK